MRKKNLLKCQETITIQQKLIRLFAPPKLLKTNWHRFIKANRLSQGKQIFLN